ncbi:glycosyltransferase family 2 protein [Flavobacteriaceae sp. LMIT009]
MLAIVIPYYKIEYFKETLDSLANQTNKNFKVFIGSDCSPDDPEDLISNYRNILNIKYNCFENNLGSTSLVKQWDRCIELSEDEDWIMILGDDDYLSSNTVETFYSNHRIFENKTNLVRCASQMIFDNSEDISINYTHPQWESASNAFLRKQKGETRSSLSEYIFRKEQYDKYKFYDFPLAWYSDDRAWLDFSEDKEIFSLNNTTVFIRMSSSSISGSKENKAQKRLASSQFYRYLVDEKLDQFNKTYRKEIIKIYFERTLALRNFSAKEWFWIFRLQFSNFSTKSFKKLVKSFFKSILKPK